MLETTRAYAREKLAESGEVERLRRRHAEYHRDLFERADTEWPTGRPSSGWPRTGPGSMTCGRRSTGRSVVDGDGVLAVALTTTAVALWYQLSLPGECRARVERALSTFMAMEHRDPRRELALQAALGWSLGHTTGTARETATAWATALRLAEELQDSDYQLRALWGLWAHHINRGEFRQALSLAERFGAVATKASATSDRLVGERMLGVVLHFLGEQPRARRHIERMLERYVGPPNRSDAVRFQYDQRVTARVTLSRVLWLQGFTDQAMRTVKEPSTTRTSTRCRCATSWARRHARWPSRAATLPPRTATPRCWADHAERHGADVWQTYGRCFRGMLLIKRDQLDVGVPMLSAAVDELRTARFVQYYTACLAALAEGLVCAGQAERGLVVVDEALARSDTAEERWILAELLRLKGELVLLARSAGRRCGGRRSTSSSRSSSPADRRRWPGSCGRR